MKGLPKRLPRVARDLPAGLFDAGMASLATFLTGLAAVNLLSDVDRGVYSVFFAAFLAAGVIPQFLIYTPAEIVSVGRPVDERLTDVIRSLSLGAAPTLIALLAIIGAAVATADETTADVTVALTVTACIAVLVSPAQDHVRRLLHIGRRSWSSTTMSGAQLVFVGAGILVLQALDVPVAWIPFGALAAANIVTLTLGLILTRPGRHDAPETALSFRGLATSGRWLLATSIVPRIAFLIGSVVIVELAGPEAMGFAESARVAAQPIIVVGMGLGAVLGPRGMEAAISRNARSARRHHLGFVGLVAIIGLVYLAIAGISWPLNVMEALVPSAFEIQGLVAATIAANIITAATFQGRNELMGGRKEVQLTWIALVAGPLILATSATAGVTGAFARPISVGADAAMRYVAYGAVRRRMYREPVAGGVPAPTA